MTHRRQVSVWGEDGEIAVLASIYASDRADQAATVNNAMAILGAGVAYATAATAFYDQIILRLPGLMVAALPFPLWMVVLYHALLAATSMRRSVSIGVVERRLLARTDLQGRDSLVGYSAVERVLNIFRARWPHRIASAITYGGTGLVTVGFTAYVISQDTRLNSLLGVITTAAYGALAALWIWCWVASLQGYRRDHHVITAAQSPRRRADAPQELYEDSDS